MLPIYRQKASFSVHVVARNGGITFRLANLHFEYILSKIKAPMETRKSAKSSQSTDLEYTRVDMVPLRLEKRMPY